MIVKKILNRLLYALNLDIYCKDIGLISRYMTVKKILNLLRLNLDVLRKNVRVRSKPILIVVEPFNGCNLFCPLCPTGLGSLGMEKGKMTIETFSRIIQQVKGSAVEIYLQNWGEPLLHNDIAKMTRLADNAGIITVLATNLNYGDAEVFEQLVDSGLKILKVELDGATESTYQAYRKGGHLKTVIDNLQTISKIKKQKQSKYPLIHAGCLVSRFNEGELLECRKMACDAGADSFFLYSLSFDMKIKELLETWTPQNPNYKPQGLSPETRIFCKDLWKMISFNWDGKVQPCCRIFDDRVEFGNILNQTIDQIWNNEHFLSARSFFASGDYLDGDLPKDKDNICHYCRGNISANTVENVDGTTGIRLPLSM